MNAHGLQPLKCILGRFLRVNSHNLGLVKHDLSAEFRSLKALKKLCTVEGKFSYAAPFGDTADIVLLVTCQGEVELRRIEGQESELVHSFNPDIGSIDYVS